MEGSCRLVFADGRAALARRVHSVAELPSALRDLGLQGPRPILVLVGGAAGLSETDLERLHAAFTEALAPLAERLGAAVIDGGTAAGVMRLMARARIAMGGHFPLVGVAGLGTVQLPGEPPPSEDAAPLEPGHTHCVLVPGTRWGDESPWLATTATALADGAPSATVLVNGGEIAWDDVAHSLEVGRPVVTIDGSGRTADALAAAARGAAGDERAQALVRTGLVRPIALTEGLAALTRMLEASLSR